MGKKGKKKAVEEKKDDIPQEYKDAGLPILKDRIAALKFRLCKRQKDRNYRQLEKDMVNRFYEITKQEVRQIEADLLNQDRNVELLERRHRVKIKVHEQRVQNLEYEHRNSRRQVESNGDTAIKTEQNFHTDRVQKMNKDKTDIKRDLKHRQLENEEDVKMMRQQFSKSLLKLRETFEHNHKLLQAQYEQQVTELKVDLELRRKVEIHEIEERKNQHINELLFNHQEAFDEIKAYYNDITHDNLLLIKSLKDEIQDMKERDLKNKKHMAMLTQENKETSEPLQNTLEKQRKLKEELKSFAKDKMAKKNLDAHFKQLEERTTEAKHEYNSTEEKYRKLEKEREELYRRFQTAVREIQRKAELGKNAVLEKKLEVLTAQFDEKQAQLSEVLAAAKLDPSVVASVTKKLEQVLGAKNRQIKDLQYQVHQCTKAYNDTIKVYESKLPALGIDPEEIGFEPIQTATSLMPARLVTRVG